MYYLGKNMFPKKYWIVFYQARILNGQQWHFNVYHFHTKFGTMEHLVQTHRCYPVLSQTALYSHMIELPLDYLTVSTEPWADCTNRHRILIQIFTSVFCCIPGSNKDDLYYASKWLIIHQAQLQPSIPWFQRPFWRLQRVARSPKDLMQSSTCFSHWI